MTVANVHITDRQLRTLAEIVHRHCGIDLHEGKRELVEARLAKRIRALKCGGVEEYLEQVNGPESEEFSHLIDAISTNLTSFFREADHFQFLRDRLLPALQARAVTGGSSRIRVWSAGCSSGEEPYSIAMTLLECLPEAVIEDIKILATDISSTVLSKAKAGRYQVEHAASIPAALRRQHTSTSKVGEVEVSPRVRNIVRFNYLNLMEPWPFNGPFDFIFCRNVMIYFDKPTQERLVNRFHDLLAPGGHLFTGHSESLTGVRHPFRYVQPTIYAKAADGSRA